MRVSVKRKRSTAPSSRNLPKSMGAPSTNSNKFLKSRKSKRRKRSVSGSLQPSKLSAKPSLQSSERGRNVSLQSRGKMRRIMPSSSKSSAKSAKDSLPRKPSVQPPEPSSRSNMISSSVKPSRLRSLISEK